MLKTCFILFLLFLGNIGIGFAQEKTAFDAIQMKLPVSLYNSIFETAENQFSPFRINEEFRKNKIAFIHINKSLTDQNYMIVPIQNFKYISRPHLDQTYQKMYFEMRLKETLLKIPDLSGINFKKLGAEQDRGY